MHGFVHAVLALLHLDLQGCSGVFGTHTQLTAASPLTKSKVCADHPLFVRPKEGRPEPIVGKFSQETLAEMIGTTRSRVSFFMNKFRKLGFIDYNGKLEVHNSLLNVVLHDKPEIKRGDEATGAE
jgi:CRP-like cAMP-binding protein